MLPFRTYARERAFSLIEVIVAMTILSVVLGGAALAVVSADSVEVKSKAIADSHAMAEKAVERLRTDLSAQAGCDSWDPPGPQGSWKATARNVKTSGSTAQTNFGACPVTYQDMRDAKGRSYTIGITVKARDRADDGFGASDTDGDLRDSYDVATTVGLAADSRAGREDLPPITVGGSVDWETGSSDDATVRLIACAVDRPDRALIAGGCNVGDASRQPISISVSVSRLNDNGSTATVGTISSGGAPVPLAPGSYRFSASTPPAGFTLLKLDPANLRVYGSQEYTIQATYMRNSIRVRVCTQVSNWDTKPLSDGYEVTTSNLHWRRTNQPGRRSMQVTVGQPTNPRQWRCGWVLTDPVQSSPSDLYRGMYDLEIEQHQLPTNHSVRLPYVYGWGSLKRARYNLTVAGARLNCTNPNPGANNSYTAPLNGQYLLARPMDPKNERTQTTNRTSFYARMPVDVGTHTLCIRFWSKNKERIRCYQKNGGGIYKWTKDKKYTLKGCFYVKTTCTLKLPQGTKDDDNNCWNGANVCATCGGGAQQGTAAPVHAQRQSGGVSGGPNDGTVACTTRNKYAWTSNYHLGWGMSANVPKSERDKYDWIGGSTVYYAGSWKGRTSAQAGHPYGVHPDRYTYNLPDNPHYQCTMSYFTAGSKLFKGNGGPYRYYECLEVSVPGRPYKVRGRLLDVSGTSTVFYGTVGTALGLAPDASRMVNYWNPFSGAGGYPQATTGGSSWPTYNVARVTNDPNCGQPMVHIDPTIEEVWETVWDEPTITKLPAPTTTNLTKDRIGV